MPMQFISLLESARLPVFSSSSLTFLTEAGVDSLAVAERSESEKSAVLGV